MFVPGAWEVSYVAARLRGRTRAEVLELHGQIGPAEQDRAVSGREPGGSPRIIVSTSLAESSLTVPGVRLVIDSGLSREPRRDAGRGMSGLVNVSCSRASAEQRAGRAARQGPGRVVRCYDQKTYGAAPAHPTPEIAVADLTGAALVLACWGSPGGRGLSLPDAPPQSAMDDAVEVLRELGAVAPDGLATDLGKALARVPADPRLARALLDGAAAVGNRTAAEAVALVAGDQRAPGADLPRLLAGLRAGKDPASRRWAEDVRRMETIARQERSGVVSATRAGGGHRRGGRRVRRRPRLPGPGRAPGPRRRAGALPAQLRDPGRASGRQLPVRARMARRRRGLPGPGPRRGRHGRRHPFRSTADGGHGRGRRPAPPERHRGGRGSARAGSRPGRNAGWARSSFPPRRCAPPPPKAARQ